MTMPRTWLRHVILPLLGALVLASGPAARASGPDPVADAASRAAITARLDAFADAFNARDEAGACAIFAPNLIATVPGKLEQDRAGLCANLAHLLARPDLTLRYAKPDIREIILAGDLAIVRLVWQLTATRGGASDTTEESGLDIFRKGADGRWSIIRFATFTMRPNKILDQ
jgi:steroid delta-isomerase